MPATVAALKVYLGVDPASSIDEEAMGAAVAAANDLVVIFRPDVTTDGVDTILTDWPPRIDQAALVEAARLYGRRGSVQGIASFADVGVSMLPRLDPDVRALLEIGEYQRAVIA